MTRKPILLQPELAVNNATSSQTGAKTYEFQVSSAADFTAIVVSADNVAEDGDGQTAWVVSQPLQGTTRYWWRARVNARHHHRALVHTDALQVPYRGIQQARRTVRSSANGSTVGAPLDVTFLPGQGVRLNRSREPRDV